jgi:hypothetical protein
MGSLSVRMNLSTHLLPSGCLMNDGLEAMPRVLSSSWKACEMNCHPWIAIARYAGLRCNSEVSQLKWSDVNWERKSLTVRSPKTEGKADHAVRIVPISERLQPIVMDLFEQAEEGPVDMVPLAKQSAPRLYQRFGRNRRSGRAHPMATPVAEPAFLVRDGPGERLSGARVFEVDGGGRSPFACVCTTFTTLPHHACCAASAAGTSRPREALQ